MGKFLFFDWLFSGGVDHFVGGSESFVNVGSFGRGGDSLDIFPCYWRRLCHFGGLFEGVHVAVDHVVVVVVLRGRGQGIAVSDVIQGSNALRLRHAVGNLSIFQSLGSFQRGCRRFFARCLFPVHDWRS